MSEALFKSADEALRWAHRVRPVGERCGWVDMVRDAEDTESVKAFVMPNMRPGGWDKVVQAGMIRAVVHRMQNKLERAVVIGRYTTWRDRDGIEARFSLLPHAMSKMPAGMDKARVVDALVQKYFGRAIRIKDLAAVHGIHRNSLTDYSKIVQSALTDIEARAIDYLTTQYREKGIIE